MVDTEVFEFGNVKNIVAVKSIWVHDTVWLYFSRITDNKVLLLESGIISVYIFPPLFRIQKTGTLPASASFALPPSSEVTFIDVKFAAVHPPTGFFLGYDFPESMKIKGGCFDIHSNQIDGTTGRGANCKTLNQSELLFGSNDFFALS